ncbi:MAG: transcription antitermination factor NusB [Clostridia bacterium]|nr:transcription antitermination factor NusB [Clostridia bacterium]
MIDKARESALKILYKIDKEQAYSNIALDEEIKENRNKLNEKDIGLISQIVYGVTTWKLTIDTIIQKYSKIKLKKISPWILNCLRMGIYQIIFLDKIPKSAAVDESVNLAKRYGHKSSSGFVNAILRKISKKDYEELFEIKDPKEKISKTRINANLDNRRTFEG